MSPRTYNEILEGRFNRFLQKYFSMKGAPPSPQLGGEVQPSWELSRPTPDTYPHHDWLQYYGAQNATGAAAQFVQFKLRNPTNSRTIAILQRIAVGGSATGQFVQLATGTTSGTDLGGGPIVVRLFDIRGGTYSSNQPAQCIFSFQTTSVAVLAPPTFSIFAPASDTRDFIIEEGQEFALAPGTDLVIGATSAATLMSCALMWKERLLADSELTR